MSQPNLTNETDAKHKSEQKEDQSNTNRIPNGTSKNGITHDDTKWITIGKECRQKFYEYLNNKNWKISKKETFSYKLAFDNPKKFGLTTIISSLKLSKNEPTIWKAECLFPASSTDILPLWFNEKHRLSWDETVISSKKVKISNNDDLFLIHTNMKPALNGVIARRELIDLVMLNRDYEGGIEFYGKAVKYDKIPIKKKIVRAENWLSCVRFEDVKNLEKCPFIRIKDNNNEKKINNDDDLEEYDPLNPKIFPISKSKWQKTNADRTCTICDNKFIKKGFKSGEHHCKKCGKSICTNCYLHKLQGYNVCKNCYFTYREFEKLKLDDHHYDYCNINELKNINWVYCTLMFQSTSGGWIPKGAADFVVSSILINSWNVLRLYLAKQLKTKMQHL